MDHLKLGFLVLGLVLIGLQLGDAIMCHVCTSGEKYDKEDCIDLKTDKFLTDCDVLSQKTHLNYTMCRKLDQTVEGSHHIDRDCAVSGENKCVLRTGTKAIKLEYCECNKDKCNGAPGQQAVSTTALAASVLVCVLTYFAPRRS